jgi:Ni,Fe-hydrogenase III large subunit
MKDLVIPGGVTVDLNSDGIESMLEELYTFIEEFERLVMIYDNNPSLEDRVRETGILLPEQAVDLGMVGIVARASGLGLDSRIQSPFPPYNRFIPQIPVYREGDVNARVWVRIDEIRESVRLLRQLLIYLPAGDLRSSVTLPEQDRSGFAAVEGWRGEIIYWVQSGFNGEINRCMVRDPSSLNWLGLEQAIHGNIVPDFPVCNKSLNQSYSGHDLYASFHPETVFFRLGGVNPRVCLCGVLVYASAQPLDFLAKTKKSSFPNWKPIVSHPENPDGN